MKINSPQTKSFLALFAVAVIGTYLSVMLARDNSLENQAPPEGYQAKASQDGQPAVKQALAQEETVPQIDTNGWKTYRDERYGFAFKYSPDWTIKTWSQNKEGFNVLEIDPGKKFHNIKIYSNPSSFYALSGIPLKEEIIGGKKAFNASNILYGIEAGKEFLTFDLGYSLSLTPAFNALVRSLEF